MRHTAVLRAPVHSLLAPSCHLLVLSGLVASLILTACAPSTKPVAKASPTPVATATLAGTPSPSPIPTFAATGPMPAVSGSLIVTTGVHTIGALNPADGSTRWTANADMVWSIANGQIIATAGNGSQLVALRASDGTMQWNAAASAPVVASSSGLVYAEAAGTPDSLAAFNASTGARQWTWKPPASDGGYVAWMTEAGATLLVGTSVPGYGAPGPHPLYALNAATGALRWAKPGVVPPYVVQGDRVYFLSWTSNTNIQLSAVSTLSGVTLWSKNLAGTVSVPSGGSVLFATANAVYVDRGLGGIEALSAANGASIWSHTSAEGARYTFTGAMILESSYSSSANSVIVTALDADSGTQKWTANAGFPTVLPDGFVYSVSHQPATTTVLDAATGAVRWTFPIEADRILERNGVLFVTPRLDNPTPTSPGTLWALDARTGGVYWKRDLPSAVLGGPYLAP